MSRIMLITLYLIVITKMMTRRWWRRRRQRSKFELTGTDTLHGDGEERKKLNYVMSALHTSVPAQAEVMLN